MNASVRGLFRRFIPAGLRAWRSERISQEMMEQAKLEAVLHQITGGRVVSGPFKDLLYASASCGSMLGPKLLGTYEMEIADTIKQISGHGYFHIIDIGAAEGYYAIGLARACNDVLITAFESAEFGRQSMEAMARENGVADRIIIRGHCSANDLRESLAQMEGECLVMCDVEGAEKDLLSVDQIPQLSKADLLVEIHDFVDPRISATLLARFQDTHEVVRIRSSPRTLQQIPKVSGLTSEQLRILACERRPCVMEWFWMRVR